MVGATSISLLLTLLTLGDVLADDQSPIVTLPQGTLRGQKVTTENHAPYYRFLGIPYAKPPLGDLRFKAPQSPVPWDGVLEAVKEGHICTQYGSKSSNTKGSEDCLYLNVYTPQLPENGEPRPVMVWIHGGSFTHGSGNKKLQGPQYLLDSGVVYVSINYRLGIFGFFSTKDEAAPGNAGLKDQVLALRWVQQNIAAFGGDPTKVTIFGQSAGGMSVDLHMMSPMSKGLFRGAIAESGVSSIPRVIADWPKKYAFEVGKTLGFSGNSSRELVEHLQAVTAQELFSASRRTVLDEDKLRVNTMMEVRPTIEPVVEGEEAFLLESPVTILEEGRFHQVPYILGVNSIEGLLNIGMIVANGRSFQEIDKDFAKVFKPELRICREEACGDIILAKIKSFYFGNKPVSNDTLENFVEFLTDINFSEEGYYTAKKMSILSSEPVYFYEFIYDGVLNFGKLNNHAIADFTKVPGATHKDELGYLFEFGVKVPEDSEAAKVRSRMVTIWTNFAKYGNPTPEVTSDIPAWLPYKSDATNFMQIGAQLQAKTGFEKKRMDAWEDVYGSTGSFKY